MLEISSTKELRALDDKSSISRCGRFNSDFNWFRRFVVTDLIRTPSNLISGEIFTLYLAFDNEDVFMATEIHGNIPLMWLSSPFGMEKERRNVMNSRRIRSLEVFSKIFYVFLERNCGRKNFNVSRLRTDPSRYSEKPVLSSGSCRQRSTIKMLFTFLDFLSKCFILLLRKF